MIDDKILKVSEDVSWIGVLDRDIVTFDIVMETKYGTSYNSYFINAEKKVIIETAKETFWEVWLEKVKRAVNPEDIDYIVLNHTEPDHSGCLARILKLAPKATVVGSGNAIRFLHDLTGLEFANMVVKDGDELDLGNKTLRFIGAPNLHWPDSMFTYLVEDEVLFTCDVFGEHYCNEVMFDDLADNFDDAFRYYFDVIMKPFSKFMVSAIEKIRNIPIKVICPGHGMILRTYWKKYVDLSEQYSKESMCFPVPNTVFLAYVSAYRNTGLIAEAIANGIRQAGDIKVDVCDIEKMDLNEIEQKLIRSCAFILGSPTFSQNILLPVYQVFSLINPIRDRGKLAAAFGSYGWSGEGAKIISTTLTSLKLKMFDEGLMVKFTPHHETLQKCHEYGRAFGEKMLEK